MYHKSSIAISCTVHPHDAHTRDLIAKEKHVIEALVNLGVMTAKGMENTTTLSWYAAQLSYSFVLILCLAQ